MEIKIKNLTKELEHRAVAELKLKKAGLLDFFTLPEWEPPFGIHGNEGTKIGNIREARSIFGGYPDPECRVLYVGNELKVDLSSADSLGLPCVVVNRNYRPLLWTLAAPHLIVPDLADPRIYPFLKQHLEI